MARDQVPQMDMSIRKTQTRKPLQQVKQGLNLNEVKQYRTSSKHSNTKHDEISSGDTSKGNENAIRGRRASSDMSSTTRSTLFRHGDKTRIELDPQILQRGEGTESLLEICAGLLRPERLDELAGVSSPFGEEVVSSRKTAIWLTKSLIKSHKFAGGEASTK